MPAGALAAIFLGNNGVQAAYNIKSFDFVLFAQAMANVNAITRRVIQDHAARQSLTPGKATPQRCFWRAMAEGCEGY